MVQRQQSFCRQMCCASVEQHTICRWTSGVDVLDLLKPRIRCGKMLCMHSRFHSCRQMINIETLLTCIIAISPTLTTEMLLSSEGHTRLTHQYLLRREEPPQCPSCNCALTVVHLILEFESNLESAIIRYLLKPRPHWLQLAFNIKRLSTYVCDY